MPPSGPRARQNQAAPPQRGANVRNEAFESIFGRPAVGHHMSGSGPGGPGPSGQPGPPPGGAYGYPQRPPNGSYLYPSQPGYPPGSAFAPLARGAPSFPPPGQSQSQPTPPPQQYQDAYRPYYQPTQPPAPAGPTPHSQGQAERPDRRASLAPSTYSSSSASFYSPTPDAISPPTQSVRRMPSGSFPTPSGNGLTPAQAYQASTGYHTLPSPASAVFPARATPSPNHVAPSISPDSSRSTPQRRPTLELDSRDRFGRAPEYLRSLESLTIEEDGPLGDIPGIPKRGADSPTVAEFSNLAARFSGEYGNGNGSSTSMHQRVSSDASAASSSYTMRNMALSHINPSPSSATYDATSPDTPTSDGGYALGARIMDRKSVDSTQSLPQDLPPGAAPSGTYDRATSFSGSSTARREAIAAARSSRTSQGIPSTLPSNRSLHGTLNRSNSSVRHVALASMPTIYPAMLSKVAEAFKQLVMLSEHVKDGLSYKDAFDGRTAVTVIAEIIKTPDRNLALLLGRALDAQKMFHDVTYDHRLRDNPIEVYQFKERLAAPFMPTQTDSPMSERATLARNASSSSSNVHGVRRFPQTPESSSLQMSDSQLSFPSASATPATSLTSLAPTAKTTQTQAMRMDDEDDDDLPVGVFTLLTDCYSPTCSRESLCYSINCPRRLEQMKRLNMKPTGLSRKLSQESIKDVKETGTLWIQSVSQEILDSVDDTEKKRQEAINEVMYTERDFVRDLEYLKEQWVKPLLASDVIAANRREDFVRQVFWNVHDVWSTNHVLAERLTKRQKQQPVVSAIGDLFLERVPLWEPFVAYGAHQLFGKYEFEKEKGANPAFQRFVDETERKPESRKLELNGYLTKPTTRLGRYPLLLEAVLKYTPDDHQDKKDLPEVIKMVRAFLAKVNEESGKSENVFELAQVEGQLVFRPNEHIDLRLRDKNRELVNKGPLKRRGGNRDEIADLMGFLFDHAFLLVKPKYVNKAEQLRVYRRPIPLELLVVMSPDETYNAKLSGGRSRLMASRPSLTSSKTAAPERGHVPPKPESKHGYSVTIAHLGKKGYSMQLWVDTYVGRKKWLEAIDKQQTVLRERSCVFACETITEGYFHGLRRINCISPYDNGVRMIYGTDEGVYFSNLRDPKLREPVKVINLLDVTQVDVIEDFQLLVVLHERSVTTFPLDCLDPNDPNAAIKRGKRISSHTSFFKSGVCLGKMLVAVVKSSTLSSTIKVLEPVDQAMRGKMKQGSFMKRLNGGNEALKLFKEFYIPTESTSVHFLKTKLCVACTKGFEIVDLETLDMQGLLDPSDQSLDFVLKRDNVRPIAIYRIEEDFLLCYDEFAFYVNKNGWRSRPKWAIIWEGVPTAFALQFPYVIAFEPTFVEVRSVHTGDLVQIIPGNNISCLFADTPPSRVNAAALPNRQMMFPRPGTGAGGGTAGYPYAPGAGPGPGQQGMGFMPPPPPQPGGAGGGGAPGAAPGSRFVRDQIIFTSDDGHVQFLKLPTPTLTLQSQSGVGGGSSVSGSRDSRDGSTGGSGQRGSMGSTQGRSGSIHGSVHGHGHGHGQAAGGGIQYPNPIPRPPIPPMPPMPMPNMHPGHPHAPHPHPHAHAHAQHAPHVPHGYGYAQAPQQQAMGSMGSVGGRGYPAPGAMHGSMPPGSHVQSQVQTQTQQGYGSHRGSR